MMTLINLLVKDIVPFAASKELDLVFIIKLIDYRLASIGIDITNDTEVETYINNVRILNNLFLLFGLATNLSDHQRTVYNNDLLVQIMDEPERLIKYKEFKLSVIKKEFTEDVKLFEEYIASES